MNHTREHREICGARKSIGLYFGVIYMVVLVLALVDWWKKDTTVPAAPTRWDVFIIFFTIVPSIIVWLMTAAERRTWRFASKILKTNSSELRQQIEIAVADWLTEHADWEVLDGAESHGEEMRKVFPESRALGEWLHELEKRKEASRAKLEQYESVVENGMRTLLTRGIRKNDFPTSWEVHVYRFLE